MSGDRPDRGGSEESGARDIDNNSVSPFRRYPWLKWVVIVDVLIAIAIITWFGFR